MDVGEEGAQRGLLRRRAGVLDMGAPYVTGISLVKAYSGAGGILRG